MMKLNLQYFGGRGSSGGKGGSAGGIENKSSSLLDRKINSSGKTVKDGMNNFLKNNRDTINSSEGMIIASNQFSYMGLTNEQGLRALNMMGSDKYETVTTQKKGTIFTNFAPIITTRLRKIR